MAILRFSKSTAATTVVRWLSQSSSSSSSPTSSVMNGDSSTNSYWIYEIPDNESQATTSGAVKASAPSACYDTYRIWDADALDNNNHYLWHQPQPQCPCSPHTLFYRSLYWCKQIILKVGRSYYALPVLLLLSTLSLGLLIGYIIGYHRGRYHDHQSQLRSKDKTSQPSKTYSNIIFPFVTRWHMNIWGLLERFPQQHMKDRNHNDEPLQSRSFVIDPCSTDTRNENYSCSSHTIEQKERIARVELKSDDETQCQSGLSRQELPYHIAVVMDGNRRYGLQQYNDPVMGHWDGSKKLVQFVKWCVAEHIKELTVYAFSTENWSRSTNEVSALMNIIVKHCEELRVEAIAQQISIHIKSTDTESIPAGVRDVLHQLEADTYHSNPSLRMNICLSYGSRGEIVQACRSIVTEYQNGNWTSLLQITEDSITQKLLVGSSPSSHSNNDCPMHDNNNQTSSHPPDIFIRTSGEVRLSNFLLWQMAYTELFFLQKNWPELNKDDFLNVLQSYAHCRQRRFGR